MHWGFDLLFFCRLKMNAYYIAMQQRYRPTLLHCCILLGPISFFVRLPLLLSISLALALSLHLLANGPLSTTSIFPGYLG